MKGKRRNVPYRPGERHRVWSEWTFDGQRFVRSLDMRTPARIMDSRKAAPASAANAQRGPNTGGGSSHV